MCQGPAVALSALPTKVEQSQCLCIWLLFWVLNPSYPALKVYSLLVFSSAKRLFLSTAKFSCVFVSFSGLFLPSPRQDQALIPMSSFFTLFSISKAKNKHLLHVTISRTGISKHRAKNMHPRTENSVAVSLWHHQLLNLFYSMRFLATERK